MNYFINCQKRVWREYLLQKYQNKNTLPCFEENAYSKNSKYKEEFFLVFPIYKRAKYKNGCYYQKKHMKIMV